MNNIDYFRQKTIYSYDLYKNRKFFKKARAIVIKDNKLLVIKVTYNDGRIHYLLPGGGVDEGETIKVAAVRETLEEYNDNVEAIKYLGKQYYKVPMELDGEKFVSNRVEYYYICKYLSPSTNTEFGIEGEFTTKKDRTYEKTTLTLDQLKNIKCSDLNDMDEKNYQKLITYFESL